METEPFEKDIYYKIVSAVTDLYQFSYWKKRKFSIEELREGVKVANLKTLEEHTGESKEKLEEALPGVCTTYNDLAARLKNPDLTMEEFDVILAKIHDRSWFSKPKK